MSVSRAPPQPPGILSPRAKSPDRNPSSLPPALMNVPHGIAATNGPNVIPVGGQPPQMVPQMPPHSVNQHGVAQHAIPSAQPAPMLPAKLLEGLEMIKSEFTAISMEATRALYHREETDTKLLQQHIGELNQIRKTVYELDQAHRQMRDKYESELVKLRQKIDTMRTQPPLAARVAQTNQDGSSQPALQPLPLPAEKRLRSGEECAINGAAAPSSVPNLATSSAPSVAANSASNSTANSAPNSAVPDASVAVPSAVTPTPSSQVLSNAPNHASLSGMGSAARAPGHVAVAASLPNTASPTTVPAVPNHTVSISSTPMIPAAPLGASPNPTQAPTQAPTPAPAVVPAPAPAQAQAQAQAQAPGQTPTASIPTPVPASFATGEISLIDLDVDQIAKGYKHVGVDYTVVYNPQFPPNLEVELVRSLQHTSVVCCVRFSDDGTRLATGCNRSAQIYDVATGELLFQLQDPNVDGTVDLYIRSVCFSPDGKFLATGAEDHKVRVWEIETREIRHVLEGHDQDIYSLMFSTNGRYVVSGSGDRNVKMWDVETGSCFRDFGIEDGVTAVALSPDDRFVAAGSLDKTVRVWDAGANQLVERLDGADGHEDSVYSVSYRPGHREIVSGSLDKTLKIWELSPPNETMQGRVRKTLRGHNDYVLSVAVTPDSKWILSGSKDRIVQMWNADTGVVQLMLKAHINSVISVAPSPTGALFASGGGDFTAKVWRYTERPKTE